MTVTQNEINFFALILQAEKLFSYCKGESYFARHMGKTPQEPQIALRYRMFSKVRGIVVRK